MAHRDGRSSAEQPLHGTVLCFTSVGPEDRSRYAELALQMGAEHKLDLTSDTTHLIVGSTDTAKYKYVAREREDIKVLRPEWIEAVRDCWINAMPLDLDAITQQYRMPTLATLKICITGFDDLSFRAQLQRSVIENGGEYTGDLTREVTHLIAKQPTGKKYEYGVSWQKKVVSLKWYQDTLKRGMQLDESLYPPTLPIEEQGIGAWNHRRMPSPRLGKRTRDGAPAPEPSRKLRRTASAKLGSQNHDLWTDIVGGAGFEAKPTEPTRLRATVSMPAMDQAQLPAQQPTKPPTSADGADVSDSFQDDACFLKGYRFIIEGFEKRKKQLLHDILQTNGGSIVDQATPGSRDTENTFLIVPHDICKTRPEDARHFSQFPRVVTELWLERCMLDKMIIDAEEYPLGQLVRPPSTPILSEFTINATGFNPLETLHISKIVPLLGASYTEVFSSTVSVLVCKAGNINEAKLQLSEHLDIPAVKETWLWSTLQEGQKAEENDHVVRQQHRRERRPRDVRPQRRAADFVEVSTIPLPRHPSRGANQENTRSARHHPNSQSKSQPSNRSDSGAKADAKHRPHSSESSSARDGSQGNSGVPPDIPLQELSSNSPGKPPQVVDENVNHAPLDGNASLGRHAVDENNLGDRSLDSGSGELKPSSIQAINGAIRDILNHHTRKKSVDGKTNDRAGKPGRLMGRALSNMSNSSVASNMRTSRASSIDSLNTDGVGSEIVTGQSDNQSGEVASLEKGNYSFKGRAKTALVGLKAHSMGMDDLDLSRRGFNGVEAAPPMTQLGYEDPEDAVLLREQLVESRGKHAKEGGTGRGNPVPPSRQHADRKIRDNDILAGAGWGAGRRTRQKHKSPPGKKDF